jgi:acyl-CoA thioesterase-1
MLPKIEGRRLQRPLPRLRGRDRQGANIKIRASVPPPQPSPASGGGSAPRAWIAAMAIAVLLFVASTGARAQARSSATEACLAANRDLSLGVALPRTAARLKAGDTLRIVAVGSSSTRGLWVLNRDATYPAVMRRELAALRPSARIEIINSGRIGERITGAIARFERDVLAHRPDLVIWQLGTNDVAWGRRTNGLKDQVIAGIRLLKSSGADVILMDLQYAPVVLAFADTSIMQAIIAEAAREQGVGLFSRFALMRRSIDAGLSRGALVAWDGLHNSTAGYDCVGRALARAIAARGQ